ncbi:MAG: type II secretion system protein [Candidatus Moranbacteria bacterium]|nr:type II secretion system protein [Candidatus Moranbacteria bacterium]
MEVNTRRQKGFTLIELLVVAGIIAIGATMSWISVSNAKKKMQVDNTCQSVAAMVNKARSYALSGVNGANKVRLHCTTNSCSVQRNSIAAPTTWTLVDNTYDFPGTQFTGAFDMEYDIPYATGVSGSVDHVIQLIGDTSVTKTLTTTNFKATCQ